MLQLPSARDTVEIVHLYNALDAAMPAFMPESRSSKMVGQPHFVMSYSMYRARSTGAPPSQQTPVKLSEGQLGT
jgi:hypothetical protein